VATRLYCQFILVRAGSGADDDRTNSVSVELSCSGLAFIHDMISSMQTDMRCYSETMSNGSLAVVQRYTMLLYRFLLLIPR